MTSHASSDRFIVGLTTHPVTTGWVRNVASRLDPLIFRATGGRFFSMGVPSMPMLTLTAIGRRSGRPRSVHLACLERGGDPLVVARAMGQIWRSSHRSCAENRRSSRARSFG